MNKKNISLFTAVALALITVFTGCSKDDGPIPKRVSVSYVPVINAAVDAGTSATITLANQAAFQGKFTVSLYFPGTQPPTKMDIVVRKNGSNANVRLYKADVTTLPASFTVTAAEIVTLFGGAALALNDTYDFGPDIYVGTTKYELFPAVGTGNGAGIVNMPLYSQQARFTVR